MYRRFTFEGDIHASLELVPIAVRRKLDLIGVKISLAGWQALPREDRLALCHLPVEGDDLAVYREILGAFASRAGVALTPLEGGPARPADWSAPALRAHLDRKLGAGPDEARLAALGEEERYALFKLADPKRAPDKLETALVELGLREGAPIR